MERIRNKQLEKDDTMGKKKKKVFVFIAVSVFVIIIGVFYFLIMSDIDTRDQYSSATTGVPAKTVPDTESVSEQSPIPSTHNDESINEKFEQMGVSIEDQLVKELQKYYGATISEKSTQASIYEVYKNFAGSRPDGRDFFYNILKRAFPELADEIMATLDKLDLYHQWLMENDALLAQMNIEEKMASLWKKRIELFGEDAQDIWVDEVMATDSRKAKMLDTLEFINGSTDTTMEDKLQLYQDSLEETYKGSPEEYFLNQKPILAKIFFSIDSVQNELKQMNPEERQKTINNIRREMGFTENMVKDMEEVDAENNKRWEVGLKYMEERKRVVSEFQGEQQKEKLKALREEYFGDEAQTIQAEEENDGFFRFERPRYYGRN
ncbi:MAG: hypothetical protein MUE70_11550 [Desulfobacterales bacterium]|jgi:hypothetical protein|nr:hypothetical protein [Desulfobacterales bacterium]